MGSDGEELQPNEFGNYDDIEVVYADEDEMEALERQADEDEAEAMGEEGAFNDFETYNEDEFAEGEEYADGQVLSLTAERNDQVCQFDEHKDSVYCVDTLPVAPFNIIASGDGADKAYVWKINKITT